MRHIATARLVSRSLFVPLLPAAMAFVAVAAIVIGSPRNSGAQSEEPTIISLDMDPNTPGVQENIKVDFGTEFIVIDIVIQNAKQIGAWEMQTNWDPIALEFLGFRRDPSIGKDFLSSTGRNITFCPQNITENSLRVGCTTEGPTPPGPSGDGILAFLLFHPRFPGESCFPLYLVETSTELGHPILPTDGDGGCITVIPHTPTPTGTATSVASATRTPTATGTTAATRTPTRTRTATATAAGTQTPGAGTGTPGAGTGTPGVGTPGIGGETPQPVSTVLGGTPRSGPTRITAVIGQRPPGRLPSSGSAGELAAQNPELAMIAAWEAMNPGQRHEKHDFYAEYLDAMLPAEPEASASSRTSNGPPEAGVYALVAIAVVGILLLVAGALREEFTSRR